MTDTQKNYSLRCPFTEDRDGRTWQCDSFQGHAGAHSPNIDATYWTGIVPSSPGASSEEAATAGYSNEPLTYEQEIHSLLYAGRSAIRDLKLIFERDLKTPGALSLDERRINQQCIANFDATLARIDAAIPLAEQRRSAPSLSSQTGSAAVSAAEVLAFLEKPVEGGSWREKFYRESEVQSVKRAVAALRSSGADTK